MKSESIVRVPVSFLLLHPMFLRFVTMNFPSNPKLLFFKGFI